MRRRARAAELVASPDRRLVAPDDVARAIAIAAESIGGGSAPARRASGWPSGASYVWRFSALPWSRQVAARRERP